MHHLHQPDQGHHLHQLQAEPEQQVQPQYLAEAGVGQHPFQLLHRRFVVGHRPLGPLGVGGQPPAAEQCGGGSDAAGDPAHGQVAPAPIGEHHRGHNQSAQAGQDGAGEPCRIQAGANGGVGRELGAEGGVGQVDAGVGGHQQDRHHGVVDRALHRVARWHPPHRRQADAQR